MNYYPFHIGDYVTNTRHLDLIEDAIYRRLIDLFYLHDGVITADINQLARLICARPNVAEVESIVKEFFKIDDDGMLRHSRCEEEINKFNDKAEKSKAAVNSRWDKSKNTSPENTQVNAGNTDVIRTYNGRNTDVIPPNNQEPILGEESASAFAVAQVTTPEKQKSKSKPDDDSKPAEKPDDVDSEIWAEWVKVRKLKKAIQPTARVISVIRDEANSAGITLNTAIAECCNRNWVAFKAEWYINSQTGFKPQAPTNPAYDQNGNVVQFRQPQQQPTSKMAQGVAALMAMKSCNRGVKTA